VIDSNQKVIGIITDGDLRRMLQKGENTSNAVAKDIMTVTPKTISNTAMAVDALALMREHNILQVLITNNEEQLIGFVHLHDILREGIV
jgi:arabinose-5-phosphate isomerase